MIPPEALEALADLVAERLPQSASLTLTPAETAELIGGVTSEWVLDNRELLGGFPLKDGPKPRIHFRRSDVEAFIDARAKGEKPQAPTRRRRRSPAKATTRKLQKRGSAPR